MAAKPPVLSRLREDVVMQVPPAQGQGLQHDAEQHVVRGLKVVGLESKKGRSYPPEALKEALALYEGVKCNVDHVPESAPDVPFASRFGVFRNVKLLGDGLWADLYYNPAHALAESFVWWSQFEPGAVGFSHDALGESRIDADGSQVVTRIHKVYSIDLVANPATTNGLRESDMPDPLLNTEPGEPEGDMAWDDQLGDLVKSIFCDTTMDKAAKRAKIVKVLNLLDDDEEDGDVEESEDSDKDKKKDEDDEDMDEKKVEESLSKRDDPASKKAVVLLESHRKEKAAAVRKATVLKLARDSGLGDEQLSEVFVESLVNSRDDAHAKRLIEDRRKHAGGRKKPISAPAGSGGASMTTDQFVAGMRGQ